MSNGNTEAMREENGKENKESESVVPARSRWNTIPLGIATSVIVALILLGTFWLGANTPDPTASEYDLPALLMASVSIGLIIFSFILAGFAVVGWQGVKKEIEERVEVQVGHRVSALRTGLEAWTREQQEKARVELEKQVGDGTIKMRTEVLGRIQSAYGSLYGDFSSTLESLEPTDKDKAKLGFEYCEAAYEILKSLGQGPRLMALNNLVFYGSVWGEYPDAAFILGLASEIRQKGNDLKQPHMLLTYCRAVLTYSKDPEQIREAEVLNSRLLKDSQLSPLQRKEAELYWTSFPSRIREFSRP